MELEITPQTRCVWVVTWTNKNGIKESIEFENKHICETLLDLLDFNKIPFKLSLKLTP